MARDTDTLGAYAASSNTGSLAVLLREARRGTHWAQLARFGAVGASGYAVNLAVYWLGLQARIDYRGAAALAFGVALVNNFAWNRLWTFRASGGQMRAQAARFMVVSAAAFLVSLALLAVFVRDLGTPKLLAQAVAIIAMTPASFLANKLWSFRSAPV